MILSQGKNPVPKRLKEVRLAFKISQKQLGIAVGIDEFSASARMNQYETGKHMPDFLTLKRIGAFLGCPVAYFYSDDDGLAKVILEYFRMSKAKQRRLIQLITSL